jgi:hypothetical protein
MTSCLELAGAESWRANEVICTVSAGGLYSDWIVNLPESQIENYAEPTADGYATMRVYKAGEDVPVLLDGAEVGRISVTDVLP